MTAPKFTHFQFDKGLSGLSAASQSRTTSVSLPPRKKGGASKSAVKKQVKTSSTPVWLWGALSVGAVLSLAIVLIGTIFY